MDTNKIIRQKIHINGIVQGVGFRPFIYRIANQCHLTGFVNNNSEGVLIEAQGLPQSLKKLNELIEKQAPPLAKINQIKSHEIPPKNETSFRIIKTENTAPASTFIAPDVCVCDDCLEEMNDPQDRRYHYPFINCTNCGPRYTIVESIPYDRPFTSMRVFPMCADCEKEYHNPTDRRFHAQPNACPKCGPQLFLWDGAGKTPGLDDPLAGAVKFLKKGKIVAIRGLGGFHLAVDAFNENAVKELRKRKGRQGKPFALMAPTVESIKKYCHVSQGEAHALKHHTRPIVLLQAKGTVPVLKAIAPGNNFLGFMLPYAPLHFLLMENFDALIMTSANFTDEPIVIKNEEAVERLHEIADYFLVHNREIVQRCDDSIIRVVDNRPRLIRRSRGFVPEPLFLEVTTGKNILAVGAELKNTIALSRADAVFFSPHIGDLDNPAAYNFFEESITHLSGILQISPAVVACDLHPEYLSTKWAKKQGLPVVEIQHHHAHLAAVMAENKISAPTIGLILDGTGFGPDGTIWGGEVLIGDFNGFERFAWLEPVAMPGSSAAIKQPWRMALSYLFSAFGAEAANLDLPLIKNRPVQEMDLIEKMILKNINSPLTSSCGRLFDTVSAILGVCTEVTFEAEAAIQLEMALDKKVTGVYVFDGRSSGIISVKNIIKNIVEDFQNGLNVPTISAKFHNTLAMIFARVAETAREKTGINRVALSGGVYQNIYFFNTLSALLVKNGFDVLTHSQVPANDGGLALGQIAIANAALQA